MTLLILAVSFLLPVLLQIYILVLYSPKVTNRSLWKWLVIYGLNILQTVVMELFIFALVFSVSNMIYVSLAIQAFVFLIFDFVNWQIMKERTMIFLPTDLVMAKGIRELIGMVNPTTIVGVISGTTLIIGAGVWAQVQATEIYLQPMPRVVALLLTIGVLAQFKWLNHPSSISYKLFRFHWKDHPFHFNQIFGAQFNGFVLQFLVNVDLDIMSKPESYTQKRMQQIYAKYASASEMLNGKRTKKQENERVILILSESLSDPGDLNDVVTNEDVLFNIHHLGKNTVHFNMVSGYVGGGTANIEYEVYTGFTNALFNDAMTTPYAHVIPRMKSVNAISRLFKDSIGVHTFTGNLYQRDLVYKKIGFEKFYTTNSAESPIRHTDKYEYGKYISDAAFFSEIMDVISENSKVNFISGISMQNHMPFAPDAKKNLLKSVGKYDISFDEYDSYLTGIKYTDEAIANFLNTLQEDETPTTVLLYGDHTPNIFSRLDAEGEMPELRLTPGFIWQNLAAEKQGNMEALRVEQVKLVGSNVLGALLYKAKNWRVTPYYALLTYVMDKLPAVVNEVISDSKLGFVNDLKKVLTIDELTNEQRELLEDYRLVQYDQTAGDQLLPRNFFE